MTGKLSIKIQIMPFLLVLDKGQLNGIFAVHLILKPVTLGGSFEFHLVSFTDKPVLTLCTQCCGRGGLNPTEIWQRGDLWAETCTGTLAVGNQAVWPHQPAVIQCSNRFHSSVLSVDQGTRG